MNQKHPLFKRKILLYLKALSRNELNEFGRLLGTPAFKCDKEVLRLFNFLKKHHPDFGNRNLREDKIVTVVFKPIGKFSARQLDKKVSALIHLVEKYLLMKEFERSSLDKKLFLGNIFIQRQADTLFLKLMETLQREIGRKPVLNTWDYFALTRANYETYFHPGQTNLEKSGASKQLQNTIESHKDYFIVGMLRLAVEALLRQMTLNEKYNIPLLREIRELALKMKRVNPLVQLYSFILFHVEHRDDSSFKEAVNLFKSLHDQVSKKEQNLIITVLINFALVLYTNRRPGYREKAFELYQLSFEHRWLENDGSVSDGHFSRAVFIGTDLGHFEWVEQFCTSQASKLREENRGNTLLISQAYLAFAEKKFETVLDLLRQANFPNIFFDLNARCLIAKSYYELNLRGNDYPVIDYCESFRHYLKRNKKITGLFSKRNLNFIKILKRLANTTPKINGLLQRELLHKIEHMPIISKPWVVEKIRLLG